MQQGRYVVHKFGGSSLASANHYRRIADILTGDNEVIVLSAAAKTTAILQALFTFCDDTSVYQRCFADLKKFQLALISELLPESVQVDVVNALEQDLAAIDTVMQAVSCIADISKAMQDFVLGFGEIWSCRLMATYLGLERSVLFIDATEVLFVRNRDERLEVDWQRTQQAMQKKLATDNYQQIVITGFIAMDDRGKRCTLGLNGSDFSASIFAKLLAAKSMTKWTDVAGVYSADPRRVKSAFPIEQLSYKEALELAYFGASIIHPQALYPAIEAQTPIHIKNTQEPDALGTLITAEHARSSYLIQGLTSIDEISLINIEGAGMVGVSGTASRVFTALTQRQISVILITQASSEHSICLAVRQNQAQTAADIIEELFAYELSQGRIEAITIDSDCAILAVVGDNMVGSTGIAGRLCSTLAAANVNIRAISQGSSERNISIVVGREDINRALNAVHGGFYLSSRTLSIGLIGPGGIGATLLEQFRENIQTLFAEQSIDLRVRGIMNSSKMLLNESAVDLLTWQDDLNQSEVPADLQAFAQHIAAEDYPHAVIIDCTSSQYIADSYLQLMTMGIHIVTPNKKANSGDFMYYQSLQQYAMEKHRSYLYETTVCAGLPIIKTLQDLLQTGDEVNSIEGVVSGTLAFIFSQLALGKSFSEAVLIAYEQGYTEPDPRDDLAGMDVARKFTCLARELGYAVTLDQVQVTSLVPAALVDVDVATFITELPKYDQEMQALLDDKQEAGCRLVYAGVISEEGVIQVDIKACHSTHPFYNLHGTDNMIIFKTRRYDQYPLVVQGPGAGKDVTAAGVFADVLRLVSRF